MYIYKSEMKPLIDHEWYLSYGMVPPLTQDDLDTLAEGTNMVKYARVDSEGYVVVKYRDGSKWRLERFEDPTTAGAFIDWMTPAF